jgi:MarR-like DNA-binding transcriptional regulator SgrR of sgrS sRNA
VFIVFALWRNDLKHIEFNSSELKFGVVSTWGSLDPALQHTSLADFLMGNTFEPLVSNKLGKIVPVAAQSWEVSCDRKIYTFEIDSSKKFSNGEPLLAHHFKTSWEQSLKMVPFSSKSGLADVLAKVAGYEEFDKTGTLRGVQVLGDKTLQVEFSSPFRTALEELAGNRYSAVLRNGKDILGTGSYRLVNSSETTAEFERQEFSLLKNTFFKVSVKKLEDHEIEKHLNEKLIDVLFVAGRTAFVGCQKEDSQALDYKCAWTPESGHISLELNSLPDRVFSSQKFRRVFQGITFAEYLSNKENFSNLFPRARIDFQFYLPFQAGRLEDSFVITEKLNYAEADLEELKKISKKQPLKAISARKEIASLIEMWKKYGISFTSDSGLVTFKEALADHYKLHTSDIILSGFSVWNGDPDGAYHVLGKNGGITSPMIQQKKVTELLEEGRQILKTENLHKHYKKVSEAVLDEVPIIHIGMQADQFIYLTNVVDPDLDQIQSRTGVGFTAFRKK